MDSYTFSSDSTSSFYVKETTSDNTVDMDNITNSILHLSSNNDLHQVEDHIISKDIHDSNKHQICSTINPSDVFVITIDQLNKASNKNEYITADEYAEPHVQNVLPDDDDNVPLSSHDVEMVLNATEEAFRATKKVDSSDDKHQDTGNDKNVDKFNMEHFLSFKNGSKADNEPKAGTAGKNNSANDKKTALIKKHFTECGSNSVKCNICSDVLLSNLSNLILHMRHVHKNASNCRSKVWKYFTKIDSMNAKCNVCSGMFVYRKRTSVLFKHLRYAHNKYTSPDANSDENSMDSADADTNADDNESKTSTRCLTSDVIVIQNSDGKLINQIKVNKSWKCFTKLPNSDKMICNLCKKIFTHNKTNDLLQHLHEEHQNLLSIKQQAITQSLNKSEGANITKESDKNTVKDCSVEIAVNSVQKAYNYAGRSRSAKSSKIWEFYTQLNNNKIRCNLCSKVLANNYSTSNLLRHLSSRHEQAYNMIKEMSNTDTSSLKIVFENEEGEPETDITVAHMLSDYKSMLTPNEVQGFSKPGSKPKPTVSETWNYYTKMDDIPKAKCKICNVLLSYTEGISSNLTRHLKSKHRDIFYKKVKVSIPGVNSENDEEQEEATDDVVTLKQSESCSDTVNKVSDKSEHTSDLKVVSSFVVTDAESVCGDSVDSLNENSQNDEGNNELDNSEGDQENSVANDSKQTSAAWQYFKKLPTDGKVLCNLCLEKVSFVKGSTYRLFRHLSIKHKLNFERRPRTRKVFEYESDSSDESKRRITRASNSTVKKTNTNAKPSSDVLPEESDSNKANSNTEKRELRVTGRTWKHFTKLDRDKAKCNICGKVLTYKLGQTSNLIKHIQLQHKDVEQRCNNSVKTKKKNKNSQAKSESKNPDSSGSAESKIRIVWKYFTQLEDNKAMCNLCEFSNILSYTKTSRSNLMRHLNRKHKYVLDMPDEDVFIQSSDALRSKENESDHENQSVPDDDRRSLCDSPSENVGNGEVVENEESQDMKSFFEYLISDEKLKRCIKYEDGQIKCKICSGSFVCNNLINYEYTIRYHVQLFHAEWTVMCFDENSIKRECISPVDNAISETNSGLEASESNYNELEAIANEVSSYMNCSKQPVEPSNEQVSNQTANKSIYKYSSYQTLSNDIWKYFTKMTSLNVRCNFCSILLSFRQHKKWNLVRHLKLKHKSKLNISYKKKVSIKKAAKINSPSRSRVNSVRNRNLRSNKRSSVKNAKGHLGVKKQLSSGTKKASNKRVNSDNISVTEKSEDSDKKRDSVIVKNLAKVKEDLIEKKPGSPSLFSSPINLKIGRTWSHFTKLEMGKAQCNICNDVLLYRGTGIDLLNDHLTGKHANHFDGSMLKSYTKKTTFNYDSKSDEESGVDEEEDTVGKEDASEKKDVDDKEEVAVETGNDECENNSVQKPRSSRVWQFFTKLKKGSANCHLCLTEISYKGTSNLIRHLQKVHSVLSLAGPVKSKSVSTPTDKTETEQSKLLAAVDLTPTKMQDKNHVCFIRLSKSTVRCKFCPRILYHKQGNMHKLMSHILFRHRHEVKRYRSLKNLKFIDIGSDVVLTIVEKRQRPPLPMIVPPTSEEKVDNRKVYRSNTWLYFTKLNDQYANCNICFNAFSYKGGSIYNLTRHLLIKHDIKLIKRFEMIQNKMNMFNPRMINLSKKRNETLLFFKGINRSMVRCKLCMKRLDYRGKNLNQLVNHLWTSHITKLIETTGSNCTPLLNSDCNEQKGNKENGEDQSNAAPEDSVENDTISRRKMSNTWNYFTPLNDEEKNMRCNICQKIFCFKSGNLSNLSRHLDRNHNIKKTSNRNKVSDEFGEDEMASAIDEGKKLESPVTNEVSDSAESKEKDSFDPDRNEMDNFFSKLGSSDEVQCKLCSEVFKGDKLSDLKDHLSSKHDGNRVSIPEENDESVDKETCDSELSDEAILNKAIVRMTDNSSTSKMKCKLCYKEFICSKDDLLNNLIVHLKVVHEQNLTDVERELLEKNFLTKSSNCQNVVTDKDNKGITADADFLKVERIVFRHFKDLKRFKNKCKICCKYISGKRPCYHRVTNDLSIRYSVSKTADMKKKSVKVKLDTKTEDSNDSDLSRMYKNAEVKHCMSINLHDNKCYECMESQQDGYCIHSLNLWIMNENKKKFDSMKNPDYNNQVSLNNNEVQIITDSLNGCGESNIIIITDNDDTSVLNYNDVANRNDGGNQDISYHIMNSINDIDDDDIKVIIYNYNSDEVPANETNQNDDKSDDKPKKCTENADANANQQNQVLEAHINRIVDELNSSQPMVCSNENNVESDENFKQPNRVAEPSSQTNQIIENTTVISRGTTDKSPRSYDLEKLTELAEVSCNEQYYKRNSLLNYTEQVNTTPDLSFKSQQTELKMSSDDSVQCMEGDVYTESVAANNGMTIEEYETDDGVYRIDDAIDGDIESATLENVPSSNIEHVNESLPQEEPSTEIVETKHEHSNNKANEVISEDVINAIFNEVIVNLQENPDDKELNLIKLNNDNIEIPSGMYLQNLKSLYRINKIVLYFSDISYKYRTARCNLCKIYLEFVEPLIYHLLMHLFTLHKDKVCTEEPINEEIIRDDLPVENSDKPRKKSPVWRYFINENNFRATCKICRFSFSYKGGAINNLSRHLRLRHYIVVSSKNSEDVNYTPDYILSYPKRRSAIKLRSKTWNYFSKEPNDWAKCRICKKYLSYRSSTINNLTRHLRTIHSKIFTSLFLDKDPILIKNEDGSLSENVKYSNGEESGEANEFLLESSNVKTRDEILQQCSYSSENNNKRKSIVWNYFEEIESNCGKCNFCSKVISCKGGGTSNLSRHLRSRHGIWIVLTSNLSRSFNETMNDPRFQADMTASGNTEDVNDTIITQEQLHILKHRKLVHKKSKTWDYFTKESPDRVRCNLCSKPLSYKCKAVHNLRRHLAKKHPTCIVKQDPVRLKLQINSEHDVLANANAKSDSSVSDSSKKFIDITDTSVVIVDEETQLPPHRPDRYTRPKKSIVWNYFEELEYGIAKCLICSKVLSFRGGGTNNLMRHLRCRHAIIIVSQFNTTTDSYEKQPIVLNEGESKDGGRLSKSDVIEQEEAISVVLNEASNTENA